MKLERTAAGLEARFQIIGAGRFGQAAFLDLWLIAWASSEALHLDPKPAPEGALPKGWCEVVSPERYRVLVKEPAVRRKQALLRHLRAQDRIVFRVPGIRWQEIERQAVIG